ncbi:MAG: hypothetical protein LBB40_01590 [Holophagales bacterium]|jgi:hypothetical protein|nr:hypothetical protein [Holophagales bacterium]
MEPYGFATLAARFGTAVVLPDGTYTAGLFDISTKAESENKFESQVIAGDPSIVLKETLYIGDHLIIAKKAYEIRDRESDLDGLLTRYFLTEASGAERI